MGYRYDMSMAGAGDEDEVIRKGHELPDFDHFYVRTLFLFRQFCTVFGNL